MNKKLKLLLFGSTSILGLGICLPVLSLTSCSKNKALYSYDSTNQKFNVSSSMFSDSNHNNIFDAYAYLTDSNSSNLESNKSKLSYTNLVYSLTKLYPEYFDNSNEIDTNNLSIDGWNINLPVLNNSLVKTICISFPTLDMSNLDSLLLNNTSNIYSVQASIVFPNMSLEQVNSLDTNLILDSINKSSTRPLPNGCIISKDIKFVGNDYINFYMFIPKIGLGLLKIQFNSIYSPNNIPLLPDIQSLNLVNNWNQILNWNVPSIKNIQFTNITPNINLQYSNSNVLSSYSAALSSNEVQNVFNEKYPAFNIDELNVRSSTEENEQSLSNLENDINYWFKTLMSNIVTSWYGQIIEKSQVFTGSNLTLNNGQINGNIAIQFTNTSSHDQVLVIPGVKDPIHVVNNATVGIIITFNNSNLTPYLTQQSKYNNTAYLTCGFNNLTCKLIINDEKYDLNIDTNVINLFDVSYSLKSVVTNVKQGYNLIDLETQLDTQLNQVNEADLKNQTTVELQNSLTNFWVSFKAIQNIILNFAENPTIYDFLTSIGNDLTSVIYQLTNNYSLASIIGNIFTNQTSSTYLYNNIDYIIDFLTQIVGDNEQFSYFIGILEDIKSKNPTPADMKTWIQNLQGLYSTLERLLYNQIGWALPIIKDVLDSLSTDKSILDTVLSNLNSILTIMSTSEQAGTTINNISSSILGYLNALVEFSNQMNSSSSPITNDNYKNLRVFDFLIAEFSVSDNSSGNNQIDVNSSIFTLLGNLIGGNIGSQIKTIGTYLRAVNFPSIIKEKTGLFSSVTRPLYDQITLILKNLFTNVTVNNSQTTTDLYSALMDNLIINVSDSSSSFSYINNRITQSITYTFNLKNTIQIDTKQIAVLLDNVTIKDVSIFPENLQTIINTLNTLGLGKLFPINIVITPSNNLTITYTANNAELIPFFDNNGLLNWKYLTNVNVQLNGANILNDSNKSTSITTGYGTLWSAFKGIISNIISFNGYILSNRWIHTTFNSGLKVSSFNNSSYINNVGAKQIVTDEVFKNNFIDFINNNLTINSNNEFVYDEIKLKEFIDQNIRFSSLFDSNKYITYCASIKGYGYKLNTNSYNYTLSIQFSTPVLLIDTMNNARLVNSLNFNISMSNPPGSSAQIK